MTKQAIFTLLAASALLLAGCGRTAESMQEDATDTTEAVLTPKIKAAIIANPILNEDGNLIDVETDQETVYLRGHVMTEEAKSEATQIAQRVLDESESKFTLVNELEVRPKEDMTDDDSDDDDGTPDQGSGDGL